MVSTATTAARHARIIPAIPSALYAHDASSTPTRLTRKADNGRKGLAGTPRGLLTEEHVADAVDLGGLAGEEQRRCVELRDDGRSFEARACAEQAAIVDGALHRRIF